MRRRGVHIRKFLIRIIFPLLRRFPPRVASELVAGIGRSEYDLLPSLRVRFDQAVERGGSHFQVNWQTRELGRELAGNHIRWRTRDQLLDGLGDEELTSLFEVVGRENLDQALSKGRGVVLLGNHFGSHMMPPHWLLRNGYQARLYMERPRHTSKYLASHFNSEGALGQRQLFISRRANTTESAGSIVRAVRVLGSGCILFIANDVRWTGNYAVPGTFLGREYQFSATWVVLAAMSKAPVVPVFCHVRPDGGFRLEFLPEYTVPPQVLRPNQTIPWVQEALNLVEGRVGADPANSNDYFFWGIDEESIIPENHGPRVTPAPAPVPLVDQS